MLTGSGFSFFGGVECLLGGVGLEVNNKRVEEVFIKGGLVLMEGDICVFV